MAKQWGQIRIVYISFTSTSVSRGGFSSPSWLSLRRTDGITVPSTLLDLNPFNHPWAYS